MACKTFLREIVRIELYSDLGADRYKPLFDVGYKFPLFAPVAQSVAEVRCHVPFVVSVDVAEYLFFAVKCWHFFAFLVDPLFVADFAAADVNCFDFHFSPR